jgi:uncharacterized membrane protein (UPF0182 family)
LVLLGLGLLLLFLVPFAAARLTDWLWYREIGFERVFFTKIIAQWGLGIPTALVAFAVIYGNARVALRGASQVVQTPVNDVRNAVDFREVVQVLLARGARWITLPASALLAFFVALGAAGQWRTVLSAANATPFGTTDPVFGRDIGYYVFTLPAIELGTGLLFGLVMLTLFIVVLPIRMFRGEVERTPHGFIVRPGAQTQLAMLAGLLLVVTAVRVYFVRVPGLLFGNHLPLTGANFVDLNTRLPALYVLAVAALIGAGLVIWAGFRRQLVPVGFRVAIGYAVVVAAGALIPAAYQRLVVQPNELARETPQILHHIRATRQAWGLEGILDRELEANTRLTPEIIAANRETIDNVRLWDREPLLQTFGQIQSIRTYYDFVAVDDDRYRIGGQLRQVMLSAREMNTASLPTRGFINEHLTYTHGMGVTLGPSNAVTAEGLPVLFIKDLPPASSIPADLSIKRPQIYYGELSNEFVLAPSRQREFDYPAGEGDAAAYSQYDGQGGVPVGSFLPRLLYAIRFGSLNIVLSADLNERTRILYYRDVRERAERALPFVLFDRDPYLVITTDGRLVWLLDGYTVSPRYPYSRAASGGVNYMRNSVKVTIDAYHGSIRAYLAEPNDPIIRTLSRIYPGLLHPIDSMPADVRAHVRYPEDLFIMQTSLFATYHMANPETFYHREDQWQIPNLPTTGGASTDPRAGAEAFLRHMVMRLPGEPDPEFILMRPFTPRQKDNLAAWMIARNDGANYGKLAVYRFPRQSLVFGPNQIVNRINQDTDVARQITLWDQRGSEVVRGELLVLPIEGALIYVQPLYLRAQGGRIPELKRVVAAHEGRVSMAGTLDSALAGLFGGRVPPPLDDPEPPLAVADSTPPSTPPPGEAAPAVPAGVAQLTRQAREHYDRARSAQRSDDWATYGTEMRRLGEVLRQLEAARPRAP